MLEESGPSNHPLRMIVSDSLRVDHPRNRSIRGELLELKAVVVLATTRSVSMGVQVGMSPGARRLGTPTSDLPIPEGP